MSIRKWLARKLSPSMAAQSDMLQAQGRAMAANQIAIIREAEELEQKFGPGGYWKHKNGVCMNQIVQQIQNEKAMKTLLLPKPEQRS
jgi:hypothetical protein